MNQFQEQRRGKLVSILADFTKAELDTEHALVVAVDAFLEKEIRAAYGRGCRDAKGKRGGSRSKATRSGGEELLVEEID